MTAVQVAAVVCCTIAPLVILAAVALDRADRAVCRFANDTDQEGPTS